MGVRTALPRLAVPLLGLSLSAPALARPGTGSVELRWEAPQGCPMRADVAQGVSSAWVSPSAACDSR